MRCKINPGLLLVHLWSKNPSEFKQGAVLRRAWAGGALGRGRSEQAPYSKMLILHKSWTGVRFLEPSFEIKWAARRNARAHFGVTLGLLCHFACVWRLIGYMKVILESLSSVFEKHLFFQQMLRIECDAKSTLAYFWCICGPKIHQSSSKEPSCGDLGPEVRLDGAEVSKRPIPKC